MGVELYRYLQTSEDPEGMFLRVPLGVMDGSDGELVDIYSARYKLVRVLEKNIGTKNYCYALSEPSVEGLDNVKIIENTPRRAVSLGKSKDAALNGDAGNTGRAGERPATRN